MWSQTPERAPPRKTGPRLDEQSAPMNPPRASFLVTPSLNSEVNDPKSHNRFQVQCNPCHGLRTHVRLHLLLKLVAPLMKQSCSWVVLMLTRAAPQCSQCLSHAPSSHNFAPWRVFAHACNELNWVHNSP